MNRPTSILLLSVLLALSVPAAVQARTPAATLRAATGTVLIKETRCPSGSTSCGTAQLNERFTAAHGPRTRAAHGRPGFPNGLRIRGKGTGRCLAESPPTMITAADGSMQFLGSATRLEPSGFAATRIAIASGKRGVRFAWLEPIAPASRCDYFDQPGTALALPAGRKLPRGLVSPTIRRRVLKHSRFTVTIAGAKDWVSTAADGTEVTGRASWKLRLSFANS
jgi:hypothetical protein